MNQQTRSTAIREQVERFTRRSFIGLAFLLFLFGLPFVFFRRAPEGGLIPFTPRYLAGVVLPTVGGGILLLLLRFARGAVSRAGRTARKIPNLPAGILGGLLAAGGAAVAFFISDHQPSVFVFFFLPAVVCALWCQLYRSAKPALLYYPFLLFALLLFGREIPSHLFPVEVAHWGTDETFATLIPREPPFIGPGGRLRPNLDIRLWSPEYPRGARMVTNSVGFRNSEDFPRQPAGNELRVLSLGDSMSTGYGADQDHFFGAYLEQFLQEKKPGKMVRVINVEVSDPAYGLYYLQNHGMDWNPHLVLFNLCPSNDMIQAEQVYGPDRLFVMDEGGNLISNPEYEGGIKNAIERYRDFAYPVAGREETPARRMLAGALVRLFRFRLFAFIPPAPMRADGMPGLAGQYQREDGRLRMIDGAASLGFFYREAFPTIQPFYDALFELTRGLDRTAREEGADFILVLFPQRYQVNPDDWAVIRDWWNLDEEDFDLRFFNRFTAEFAAENGIALCDPLDRFIAEDHPGLFLPGGDLHFTRRGHRVAAEAVAECVKKMINGGMRFEE